MLKAVLMKLIYLARRFLFHTRLGKTAFAAAVYRLVFAAAAPDLGEPIIFRDTALYVDPADRTYVPTMVGGYYEERELDIFERLVTEASVLFDVGANIGIYSVIGCLKGPGLVSYAFEPIAENQDILRRNIAKHGLGDRIFLQPLAVSTGTGEASIHLGHSGTHSLEGGEGGATRTVDTVSLDDFVAQSDVVPDIIKIDVEGHEAAVLDGARKTFVDHRPTVLMEYVPSVHRDVEGLVARMRSISSSCFLIDEIGRTVVEVDLDALDRRKSANVILTANSQHAQAIRQFVVA